MHDMSSLNKEIVVNGKIALLFFLMNAQISGAAGKTVKHNTVCSIFISIEFLFDMRVLKRCLM